MYHLMGERPEYVLGMPVPAEEYNQPLFRSIIAGLDEESVLLVPVEPDLGKRIYAQPAVLHEHGDGLQELSVIEVLLLLLAYNVKVIVVSTLGTNDIPVTLSAVLAHPAGHHGVHHARIDLVSDLVLGTRNRTALIEDDFPQPVGLLACKIDALQDIAIFSINIRKK